MTIMNMMLIVVWTLLGLCLVPLIGATLLAAVAVSIKDPREFQ